MRPPAPATLASLLVFSCIGSPWLTAQQAPATPQTSAASETGPAPLDSAGKLGPDLSSATTESGSDHLPSESLARIVRLSHERGTVQLDRSTGQGFETAAPNMPIVQGARLRTIDGLAEVEFEDNSSLRLTPGSEVDFPQLKLRQTGVKVSEVRLLRGSIYVSLGNGHDNELSVLFGDQTLTLGPSSHVHLFAGQPVSRLTVFNGEARVQGPLGVSTVGKKQTLTFDSSRSAAAPLLAKGIVQDSYDEWDKTEVDYQKRYSMANSFAGSPYSYGVADLNYYGSYFNSAGCGGQFWQPYLVGAGWSPYSAGLWSWYPGAGYSYVSMYPWGWTPFHSGEWSFCQGRGWGWRPSGGWAGVQNLRKLSLTNSPSGTPIKPPSPPLPRHPTSVVATSGAPLPLSGLQPTGEFRFQSNSAGLGIPRGSFTHLDKISRGVEQHGSVSRTPSLQVVNTLSAAQPGAGRTNASAQGRVGTTSLARSSSLSSSTGAHTSVQSTSNSGASHAAAPSSGGGSHK